MKLSVAVVLGALSVYCCTQVDGLDASPNKESKVSQDNKGKNAQSPSASETKDKRFIKGWEYYYNPQRDVISKRSAKVKRSTGYSSTRGNSWKYPSNLMVLLRGRKRSPEPESFEDLLNAVSAEEDLYTPQLPSSDRVVPPPMRYRYKGSPIGSRRFMSWRDGSYLLG